MTSDFKVNFQPVASSYSPTHTTLYLNGRKLNQKMVEVSEKNSNLKGFSLYMFVV